jgi:quinol monooxygenase YgiN
MSIKLTVSVTANPDGREQLLEVLRADVVGSRQEPGNVRFDLYVQDDDPNRFVLIEEWPSQEAFEYHTQQDYLMALREAFDDPALCKGRVIWRLVEDA